MARRVISLKWPAVCADCGTELPAGAKARYYGRDRTYGTECHDREGNRTGADPGGDEIVGGGRCEDYPCCGHGPPPQGDGGGCPLVTASGEQRWRCAGCGKILPKRSTSALCGGCHRRALRLDT